MNKRIKYRTALIKKLSLVTSLVCLLALGVYFSRSKSSSPSHFPDFTPKYLATFSGVDSKKPIYIALNGLVYDVSEGREFYALGGAYHDLAGKDSSKELNLFGGEIIKRKYPIVGKLVK